MNFESNSFEFVEYCRIMRLFLLRLYDVKVVSISHQQVQDKKVLRNIVLNCSPEGCTMIDEVFITFYCAKKCEFTRVILP